MPEKPDDTQNTSEEYRKGREQYDKQQEIADKQRENAEKLRNATSSEERERLMAESRDLVSQQMAAAFAEPADQPPVEQPVRKPMSAKEIADAYFKGESIPVEQTPTEKLIEQLKTSQEAAAKEKKEEKNEEQPSDVRKEIEDFYTKRLEQYKQSASEGNKSLTPAALAVREKQIENAKNERFFDSIDDGDSLFQEVKLYANETREQIKKEEDYLAKYGEKGGTISPHHMADLQKKLDQYERFLAHMREEGYTTGHYRSGKANPVKSEIFYWNDQGSQGPNNPESEYFNKKKQNIHQEKFFDKVIVDGEEKPSVYEEEQRKVAELEAKHNLLEAAKDKRKSAAIPFVVREEYEKRKKHLEYMESSRDPGHVNPDVALVRAKAKEARDYEIRKADQEWEEKKVKADQEQARREAEQKAAQEQVQREEALKQEQLRQQREKDEAAAATKKAEEAKVAPVADKPEDKDLAAERDRLNKLYTAEPAGVSVQAEEQPKPKLSHPPRPTPQPVPSPAPEKKPDAPVTPAPGAPPEKSTPQVEKPADQVDMEPISNAIIDVAPLPPASPAPAEAERGGQSKIEKGENPYRVLNGLLREKQDIERDLSRKDLTPTERERLLESKRKKSLEIIEQECKILGNKDFNAEKKKMEDGRASEWEKAAATFLGTNKVTYEDFQKRVFMDVDLPKILNKKIEESPYLSPEQKRFLREYQGGDITIGSGRFSNKVVLDRETVALCCMADIDINKISIGRFSKKVFIKGEPARGSMKAKPAREFKNIEQFKALVLKPTREKLIAEDFKTKFERTKEWQMKTSIEQFILDRKIQELHGQVVEKQNWERKEREEARRVEKETQRLEKIEKAKAIPQDQREGMMKNLATKWNEVAAYHQKIKEIQTALNEKKFAAVKGGSRISQGAMKSIIEKTQKDLADKSGKFAKVKEKKIEQMRSAMERVSGAVEQGNIVGVRGGKKLKGPEAEMAMRATLKELTQKRNAASNEIITIAETVSGRDLRKEVQERMQGKDMASPDAKREYNTALTSLVKEIFAEEQKGIQSRQLGRKITKLLAEWPDANYQKNPDLGKKKIVTKEEGLPRVAKKRIRTEKVKVKGTRKKVDVQRELKPVLDLEREKVKNAEKTGPKEKAGIRESLEQLDSKKNNTPEPVPVPEPVVERPTAEDIVTEAFMDSLEGEFGDDAKAIAVAYEKMYGEKVSLKDLKNAVNWQRYARESRKKERLVNWLKGLQQGLKDYEKRDKT